MTDLSRRSALALAAAAAAVPALAHAQGAPPQPPTVWDLRDLYPSPEAWEARRAAVQAALPGLAQYKGHLGDSAQALKAALTAISSLNKEVQRLGVYADLKADENLGIAVNQERRQLSVALSAALGEATAWVNPEVLTVGAARIDSFLAADPDLHKFAFGLHDTLRLAPHTLDGAGEALLAATAQPLSGPNQIRNQLADSDIPWPEVTLSTGKLRLDNQGYGLARAAPLRADRKLVFDTFFGTLKTYESTFGACLATQVQGDVFQAKARRYDSAVAAALAPHNLPVAVYETLVAEANAGLPVLHRYFDLRRRMLGLSDMAYYDIYPPVTKLDRKFDIATTRALTLEAVKPLGPDYVATLSKATMSAWMHVYPQKGKDSRAYMNGAAYDVHPYVQLNHTDDYEGLTTFAHEWGHAMHTVLDDRTQPFETSDYPIFTAEIASTLNEQLLADYMLKNATTRDEKLFYLDRLCELLRLTFYRQTMFAEFELAIHQAQEKGEALSGSHLSAIYLEILKKYHGPGVAIDPVYAIEWAFIPHFYYDFYVFQYATSIAASAAFTARVQTGKPAEREAYLNVLRAGGSAYPVDILKASGVDMTTPEPYRALVAKLAHTVDQMEALIG